MTRHKSLATAMSALLAYKNRPEGDPVPVKTNWSLTPANDNEPEVVAELKTERRIQVLPTVEEIMRQVATKDVERGEPTEMTIVKDGKTKSVKVPGPILRIGRLRFSDGHQVERGYKIGPDGGAVGTELRMPAGAMLGCREQESRTLGGEENPVEVTASNNYFADMFGTGRHVRRTGGKKSKRTTQSHAEAKAELAEAYANTPDLPPATKCPPGLPMAGGKVADSFLGMKKAAKGESGSMGWQDISTAMVDREIWAQAIADLSERDRRTLDAVAHGRASTYEDLGVRLGQSPLYAKYNGGGKRALKAANQNLGEVLKKISA